MALFSDISPEALEVGEVVKNRTPSAELSLNGAKFRCSLATHSEPCGVPWHPQGFDGDTHKRVNLTLIISPECKEWVQKVEAAVLTKLQADPAKFLEGATADMIALLWRSALKDGHAAPMFRVKMTSGGYNQVRTWGPGRQRIQLPDDLGGSKCVPLICAKHVWISNSTIGILWECSDLLVVSTRPPEECPWDV